MIPFKYYRVKLNSSFLIDNKMNIYFYDNAIFFLFTAILIFFFASRVLILCTGEQTMI